MQSQQWLLNRNTIVSVQSTFCAFTDFQWKKNFLIYLTGARISTELLSVYCCWTSSVCFTSNLFSGRFFFTKLLPLRRRFHLFGNDTAIQIRPIKCRGTWSEIHHKTRPSFHINLLIIFNYIIDSHRSLRVGKVSHGCSTVASEYHNHPPFP